LERRVFRSADALITVSVPLADSLQRLHPELPTHAILNGFDPELTGPAGNLTPEFSITHTGTFYQGRRDPSLLFQAVSNLIAAGRIERQRIRIRLFSRGEPWLAALVRAHALEDVVELHPWVPWQKALRVQQESQVLVLMHWGAEPERGVYTGKVFEYLAARRPVLVIGGGKGVLSELLEQTGAGVQVADLLGLQVQLLNWWEAYSRSGRVPYDGDPRVIQRYSHVRMAEEFAQVLDSVQPSAIERAHLQGR
jgi:glycosyltransferase involved in cell wall biosynthesis